MQKVIGPGISYSVSDTIIWQVWNDTFEQQSDLSQTNSPVNTGQTIRTGKLIQTDSKEQLTVETILGIQASIGSMNKVFARDLDLFLDINRTLLVMESHKAPQGLVMPNITGFFRLIQRPKNLNSENWLYLYRLG